MDAPGGRAGLLYKACAMADRVIDSVRSTPHGEVFCWIQRWP